MPQAVLARQPILDRKKKTFAYELLFRSSENKKWDGEKATAEVITNSIESIGLNNITGNKPAFINFTAKLIKDGIPDLLPSKKVYLEILENQKIDKISLEKIREYKELKYKIVLDDFIFKKDLIELVELADIIKIDFLTTKHNERKQIIKKIRKYNSDVKFLAEKVETHEEFQEAWELGYQYFQGYFFTKPEIIKGEKIDSHKFTYLKLLDELNKKEPNFKLVEKVIKQDVSMSYSLLSIINSAAYGYDVKSIRQAIVLLGIDRLRKWCTLYFLKGLSQDKPDILFKTTLIRGYFAEFLAENFIDEDKELFMLGAFSLIDVYLDRKIEDILNEVSIPSDFRSALIDREGKLGDLLTLIETFNRFDSDKLDYYLNKYSLDLNQVSEKYLESLQIADKILSDFE